MQQILEDKSQSAGNHHWAFIQFMLSVMFSFCFIAFEWWRKVDTLFSVTSKTGSGDVTQRCIGYAICASAVGLTIFLPLWLAFRAWKKIDRKTDQ